jgi:hypothetical protein
LPNTPATSSAAAFDQAVEPSLAFSAKIWLSWLMT